MVFQGCRLSNISGCIKWQESTFLWNVKDVFFLMFNVALLCAEKWADALFTGILCVLVRWVAHYGLVLASGVGPSCLFGCFIQYTIWQSPDNNILCLCYFMADSFSTLGYLL